MPERSFPFPSARGRPDLSILQAGNGSIAVAFLIRSLPSLGYTKPIFWIRGNRFQARVIFFWSIEGIVSQASAQR